VGHDFVLVSSNAGVNLFIGNNEQAVGVFHLPPESGLSNYDLHGSSVEIAERETGERLKTSQVSKFWAKKTSTFVLENPTKEAALIWQKFLLLWNFYEIPNHLNFYYIRSKFAPILHFMFVGFWLIAPLAVVGIIRRWIRGLRSHDKIYIAFLITYMVSLLPFFITARYRLPMVPVLIAFASVTLVEIFNLIKKGAVKELVVLGIGLIVVALFVNWQRMQFKYSYQRIIIGTRYIKRALENPQVRYNDFYKAIVELKWAIETEPFDPHAHYQLGKAYASIGYYSGAVREWEETLNIDPAYPSAAQVLQIVRERFKNKGDIVSAASIPETPFEEARSLTAQKHFDLAVDMYRTITREDPFHFQAWSDLGIIFFERERYGEAIHVYYQGLRIMPDNVVLLYGLARTYYRMGETEIVKQLLEQCLEIDSANERVLELLRRLNE
jgi:tetratricopeptide (TPR) repeat protein